MSSVKLSALPPLTKHMAPISRGRRISHLMPRLLAALCFFRADPVAGLTLSPLLPNLRRHVIGTSVARTGPLALSVQDPSFDDLFAQGTAYVQSGDLDLAVGYFQRAAKLDPSHEPTQKLLEKLSGLGLSGGEDEPAPEPEDEPELMETAATRDERVDAALAELGRTGNAAAAAEALESLAPSPELRPGALIFVAGSGTELGAEAMRGAGETGFTARAVDVGLSPACCSSRSSTQSPTVERS